MSEKIKEKKLSEKEAKAARAASKRRIFRLERRARKKRHDISLRFFITLMVILVSAAILGGYIVASTNFYLQQNKSELNDKLKFQGSVLAGEILNNSCKLSGEKDLNKDIEAVAKIIGGRVMVVDSDYKIIKDTFREKTNSYMVSEDVIKAMKSGNHVSKEEEGYLQYIYTLNDGEVVHGVLVLLAPTDDIYISSNQRAGKGIEIFVIIMILGVLAAIAIGTASVRGLTYINRQMEFTGDGHFDNRIPEKGFREFRMMTEKYNATINKLMVIDSTRQEFVSNVSHELKTPITSMKVLADSLIENEQADLPMYKEFMTDIVEEIDRETKIINDLLTLVKMDKKSAKLNIAELDINSLLEVILKRVTPIAQSRGIEISYESYRDVVAEVDEVKLSLAFNNIIENAVKYNVDNGWVKVTLNSDHKYFYVKVADSGVGIPDDCKDLVFDRFYRVDKARSRDTGGTGLGLAITREAVLMHKGNVKLYSESGQGTTFTIKIPLKYADV